MFYAMTKTAFQIAAVNGGFIIERYNKLTQKWERHMPAENMVMNKEEAEDWLSACEDNAKL